MSDTPATEQPASEPEASPHPVEAVEAVESGPAEPASAEAEAETAGDQPEDAEAEAEDGAEAGDEGAGAGGEEAEAEAAADDDNENGDAEDEEEMKQQVAAKIAAIIAAGDETITMRMVKEELQASFGDSVYSQFKQFIKDTVQQEIERKESAPAAEEPEPEPEAAEEAEEPSEAEEPEPEEEEEDDEGSRKKRNKHSDKGRKKKRQKHRRDESGDEEEEEDKPTAKKRKRKDGGPQRPRSAFNYFSTDNRRNISKMNPDASFGEVSKLVADRWKALSSADKKPYEQRAKEDKARYDRELKEYLAANPEAAEKFKSKKSKEGAAPRKKKATSGSESSDDEKTPAGPKSKFEEVLDALKPKRKRKSELSDEEQQKRVQLFIMRMQDAANKDSAAVKEGTPAIFKLQMIKDVEEQVAKKQMQETMMDKGLLAMLKIWLSPLVDPQHPPPGALPNKNLREAIFSMLERLHITDQHLEKSEGLGQVVATIAQHPQETPQNKQRLKLLMQRWCRHLFGKDATANYKLLEEVERERQREIQERRAALASSNAMAQNLHKTDDSNRRRARIPQSATFDYAIRPNSNEVAPPGRDRPQKEVSAQKMNLMRTLKSRSTSSKSDQAHAAEVSITKA